MAFQLFLHCKTPACYECEAFSDKLYVLRFRKSISKKNDPEIDRETNGPSGMCPKDQYSFSLYTTSAVINVSAVYHSQCNGNKMII